MEDFVKKTFGPLQQGSSDTASKTEILSYVADSPINIIEAHMADVIKLRKHDKKLKHLICTRSGASFSPYCDVSVPLVNSNLMTAQADMEEAEANPSTTEMLPVADQLPTGSKSSSLCDGTKAVPGVLTFSEALKQTLKEAELAFKCKGSYLNDDLVEAESSTTSHQSSDTLADIQEKIKSLSNEEPDLETSFTLAAELGNVLLIENNKLRLDLQNQILENSKLAQKILEIKNSNEIIYQDQADKLHKENQTLISKISVLVKELKEAEHQLEMERKLRNQLSVTFEDHDKEKEETIKKCEKTIKEQQTLIETFKLQKLEPLSNVKEPNKITEDAGTQTSNTIPSTESNTHLLVEIEQIKIRLRILENLPSSTNHKTTATPGGISDLNHYLLTTSETTDNNLTPGARQTSRPKLNQYPLTTPETTENNITPGTRQTSRQKLNHHPLTTTVTTDNNLTLGARQTRRQKLNHHPSTTFEATNNNLTPGTRQTRRQKLNHHPSTTFEATNNNLTPGTRQKLNHQILTNNQTATRIQGRDGSEKHKQSLKTNVFSVSLQALKYRAACTIEPPFNPIRHTPINLPHQETEEIKTLKTIKVGNVLQQSNPKEKLKATMSPPITATKLAPGETIADFYNKHIEKLTEKTTRQDVLHCPPNSNSTCPETITTISYYDNSEETQNNNSFLEVLLKGKEQP
ncbi:hypothetical protein J6590_060193 [Homalodisca vitripennis]|nr:hypothetical protein J6590_060193 [Homalodisca vitripennis]